MYEQIYDTAKNRTSTTPQVSTRSAVSAQHSDDVGHIRCLSDDENVTWVADRVASEVERQVAESVPQSAMKLPAVTELQQPSQPSHARSDGEGPCLAAKPMNKFVLFDEVLSHQSALFDEGSRQGMSYAATQEYIENAIPNIRDLAISSCLPNMRREMLFRAARPFSRDLGTLFNILVNLMKVRMIIDMRDDDLSAIRVENESRLLISQFYRCMKVPSSDHPSAIRRSSTPQPQPKSDSSWIDAGSAENDVAAMADGIESDHLSTTDGQGSEKSPKRKLHSSRLSSSKSSRAEHRQAVEKTRDNLWASNLKWFPDNIRDLLLRVDSQNLRPVLSMSHWNERKLLLVNIFDSDGVRKRVLETVTTSPYLPVMVLAKVTDRLTGTALAPFYFCKYFVSMRNILESYVEMIKCCGGNFANALKLVTMSDGPVLYHCSLGKDRTGILTMLILSILGATDSAILFDYSLSDLAGPIFQDYSRKFIVEYSGLSEGFCKSEVETARGVLDYIRHTYGSVNGYLDYISFDLPWREAMRSKYLLPDSWEPERPCSQ